MHRLRILTSRLSQLRPSPRLQQAVSIRAHVTHRRLTSRASDDPPVKFPAKSRVAPPAAQASSKPAANGVATTSNPRLFMVFTCAKCNTRAVKNFTRNAYERGVVIITCPGCEARHVIADNLGWFGKHRNVEEILKEKGESIRRVTDGDIDFVP